MQKVQMSDVIPDAAGRAEAKRLANRRQRQEKKQRMLDRIKALQPLSRQATAAEESTPTEEIPTETKPTKSYVPKERRSRYSHARQVKNARRQAAHLESLRLLASKVDERLQSRPDGDAPSPYLTLTSEELLLLISEDESSEDELHPVVKAIVPELAKESVEELNDEVQPASVPDEKISEDDISDNDEWTNESNWVDA